MSNFPTSLDDDTTLPFVNDNIDDIGADAINALRDATFAIEQNIGLTGAGTAGDISTRLDISLFPDGSIKPSALTSLGLVTLPITDNQISNTAQIVETKLKLDHRTQDLFNYITSLSSSINSSLGWISSTGSKLDPHLLGAIYRHTLSQIDVDANPANFLKNNLNTLRNNTNSYFLINDINNELLTHQFADGSPFTTPKNIFTYDGSSFPSNYGHTASGIFLNTTRFATIPQTANDVQQFAEFIDSSSIFLYGTRIQNLYTNGISRVSRSASLITDGYGAPIIPTTPVIAYLLNTDTSSGPVDDINNGDDIIEFKPATGDETSNAFDAKFALVKIGDIIRINYGTIELQFIINEKKYIQDGGDKKYVVRIAGKNFQYSATAVARIDRPLANDNKYGVLSVAAVNNTSIPSSLIIGNPRGAQTLGVGFSPDQFDASHYLLYLALYPTGNPADGYTILPAVDVTGNKGASPGKYDLDYVVNATNSAFRQTGYNYRFIAFQYQGEFGIMMADSYNNAGFSILNGVVSGDGFFDQTGTESEFPNNVIDMFPITGATAPDPLGFGPSGSGASSPPFLLSYGSAEASQNPTKLFLPLKRNNYYVNGVEQEKLNLEIDQSLDAFGDGYWVATIINRNVFPGPAPTGRVATTYHIPLDLSSSDLKIGKTIVIQSFGSGSLVDFGRFIIQAITFGCAPDVFTDITVYDAVHANGISPVATLGVGNSVALYFNDDSVSFNMESATDFTNLSPFKRHFEIYVNQDGQTFTHERGRINVSGSTMLVNGSVNLLTYSELQKLDIIKISPKLRGYQFGSVNKITLNMVNLDSTSGVYSGYLASYDGIGFTHQGPLTVGTIGETIRFYDETNVDYIDIKFDVNISISDFSNQVIDFQLFPTLSLDGEVMLIATCQYNDISGSVSKLEDERQFGNTSEKDLSTSALSFLALPEKLLHSNGVLRGFDLVQDITNPNNNQIYLNGGLALVNGQFIEMNNETVEIPIVQEQRSTLFNINWALCINDSGEYQPIPLLDFDPTLNTPTTNPRRVKLFNPINGNIYFIDAVSFSDIINFRKDLALLYIVASTVSGTSTSLSVSDARKYVNDVDTNLPLRLTSSNAQGNFRDLEAILNWVKYNNIFNSIVFVKGADITTGAVNTAITLDFTSITTIDGENNATLTMNDLTTFGSNVILQNLDIHFVGGIAVNNAPQNISFINCNIVIDTPITSPTNNVIFDMANGNNITIQDCNITINYTSTLDPSVSIRGFAFHVDTTTNFQFLNSVLAINYQLISGSITPGGVFWLDNSPGVIISNSEFSGNFNKFIKNDSSNGLRFNNSKLTSTYNPLGDTNDGTLYDTTNLVNNGSGWFRAQVSDTLDDIVIDNISFNYNPGTALGSYDRYSFINIALTTNTAILSNVSITNCKFNNLGSSGLYEDIRPAISIISSQPSGTTSTAQQPIISNINISNNYCNRNQSIIITSKVSSLGHMIYPGLVPNNCSIKDNICGTIGYWVSSGSKTISIPPNVNSITDKNSGLLIENNNCHYISNLDNKGQYFLPTQLIGGVTTNFSSYPSGYVQIARNKANWIHVGATFEENSALQVVDNNCTAYDPLYLNQYNDNVSNSIFNSTGYAIFVASNKRVGTVLQSPGENNKSECVISGNTTSTGFWLNTTNVAVPYTYSGGYIFTQTSAVVSNNILKGCSDTTSPLILLGGSNSIVSQNQIYRQNQTVQSFIGFGNFDTPAWDGTSSNGTIVDNFLDSPTVDGTNTQVINVTSVPPSATPNALLWIIERNKNQSGTFSVPITNMLSAVYGNGSYFFDAPTAFTVDTASNVVSPSLFSSSVLRIVDSGSVSVTTRTLGWQSNIDNYVPIGARITSAKMGVKTFSSLVSVSSPASAFTLTLAQHVQNANYLNLDNFATVTSPDPYVTGAVIRTLNAAAINGSDGYTMLLDIDLENINVITLAPGTGDVSQLFVCGSGISNSVSLSINFKSAAICNFLFSPLIVTYKW